MENVDSPVLRGEYYWYIWVVRMNLAVPIARSYSSRNISTRNGNISLNSAEGTTRTAMGGQYGFQWNVRRVTCILYGDSYNQGRSKKIATAPRDSFRKARCILCDNSFSRGTSRAQTDATSPEKWPRIPVDRSQRKRASYVAIATARGHPPTSACCHASHFVANQCFHIIAGCEC